MALPGTGKRPILIYARKPGLNRGFRFDAFAGTRFARINLLFCVCLHIVFTTVQAATPPIALSDHYSAARYFLESGQPSKALAELRQAADVAVTAQEASETAIALADVLLTLGRADAAANVLESKAAETSLSPAGRVDYQLVQGRLAAQRGLFDQASEHFNSAATAAGSTGDTAKQVRAQLNDVRVRIEAKDLRRLDSDLHASLKLIDDLPDSRIKAELLISAGSLYQQLVSSLGYPVGLRSRAQRAFVAAGRIADAGSVNESFATAYLAELYSEEGRFEEALELTRRAVRLAQSGPEDAQAYAYRWEWQLGRIHRENKDRSAAIDAYARSIALLAKHKASFPLGVRGSFEKYVRPVYTQYADLLLEIQPAESVPAVVQVATSAPEDNLKVVRNLLESLKQAEVEDYFATQCLTTSLNPASAPGWSTSAAVIYPVLLSERTDVLIEVRGQLHHFTSAIGRNQMRETVRSFRVGLERNRRSRPYLDQAQKLYSWLIAPAERLLEENGVDTLVIVPEGPLRTIPLAALHDGKGFLIERFSVATTPAVNLTQLAAEDQSAGLLVGGVSDAVQGFSGLPSVQREIEFVRERYESEVLENKAFNLETVELELSKKKYSIAHFATHGEFSSRHQDSFILTYDNKLTMGNLQRLLYERGSAEPLDLLVLSACQTAVGDERAALGLAGVAIQSGARSALASLWRISDLATAELMSYFYTELAKADSTKASSLRHAQLSLLGQDKFSHPSFWAPFLLIGDWM